MAGIDGLISAMTTQLIEALVRAKSAEEKAEAAIKMASDCVKEVLVLKAQSYDPFAPKPSDATAQASTEAPKVSPFALDKAVVQEAPRAIDEIERPVVDDSLLQNQIWGDAINDV